MKPDESTTAFQLPERLGLAADIRRLRGLVLRWVEGCHPEVRDMVRKQLAGPAKYFRPVTAFACYRSVSGKAPPPRLFSGVLAIELTHNVTLIVDDILDRSRYRRGRLALHCRVGFLPALMAAGYISSAGSILASSDKLAVCLQAELLQRLAVAECLQWRLRRQPLGVEDWRLIASEDTGSMFEICARMATRDDRLRKFGNLLGMLYHGCDDVADVRGSVALGGGRDSDIEDGILTLPAALAVRHPETALLFRQGGPKARRALAPRLVDALPHAEDYLDKIAEEAKTEAIANATFPDLLIELVHHTRLLSGAKDAANSEPQIGIKSAHAKSAAPQVQATSLV